VPTASLHSGVDASCNCAVAPVPAFKRAADAIAANPGMSNTQIAEKAGVSEWTVRDAKKKSGSRSLEPETSIDEANPEMSTRVIAAAAGVSQSTAIRAKRKSGEPFGSPDPDERPTIDEANPGKSTRQVGEALGLDHSTVVRARQKSGGCRRTRLRSCPNLNFAAV
jgi:transposase-like protein